MSLQKRRAVGLLAAVATVASACGKPAPGPGVSATPSATPTRDAWADFRFAINGEPTFFSPWNSDPPTAWVNRFVCTGLYRVVT